MHLTSHQRSYNSNWQMTLHQSRDLLKATELRAANAGDVEDIARIWHRGWSDGHAGHVPEALHAHRGLDAFRARVPPRIGATTAATVDGVVIGFVTVHDDEVEQIYVAAEARGGGAAAALLARAEALLAAR